MTLCTGNDWQNRLTTEAESSRAIPIDCRVGAEVSLLVEVCESFPASNAAISVVICLRPILEMGQE